MKKTIAMILSIFVLICVFSACSESAASDTESTVDDTSEITSDFTASMINPLVKSDADEISTKLGFALNVPEGAENVEYYILNGDTEELHFKLDRLNYTARLKPTAKFEDISGMYFTWTHTLDDKLKGCECKLMRHNGEKEDIDVCLWYDAAPGLMYSLTTSDTSLDGFDITAIAQRVYQPMQKNAE